MIYSSIDTLSNIATNHVDTIPRNESLKESILLGTQKIPLLNSAQHLNL